MSNPINIFKEWYEEELKHNKLSIPSACCLSTIGVDGYPNARFVSLKDIAKDAFIVTGALNSRKGFEIQKDNKVALTFWWEHSQKQIRIQGNATIISEAMAEKYFNERDEESQLVSILCNQGKEIPDIESFYDDFEKRKSFHQNKNLQRPPDWGGFSINPFRIEFMKFQANRFHHRTLYELINEEWQSKFLQP